MKIGVFGGTFDPVHSGHLITAAAVKKIRHLDKILFVPCHISPHKTEFRTSSPEDRLNMLQLAIEGRDDFIISTLELFRGGISYMVDTLTELKKQFGELELIIGFDNLEKFYTWKYPDRILELAKLIVMRRETDRRDIPHDRFYNAAIFVDTPVINISSTAVRLRASEGQSLEGLVPDKVSDYITTHGLYRSF